MSSVAIYGLLRLDDDGSLDTGFATSTSTGFVNRGHFITPAIDGSFDIYVDTNLNGRIIRLNADGSTDTDFDHVLSLFDEPEAVAIATDGSNDVYVGAGFVLNNSNFIRLTPTGTAAR